MKFRKSLWLTVVTASFAILLSSCNMGTTPAPTIDVGAIQTEAFGVVLTQSAIDQTQTALAIPPTPIPTQTLFPTATFLPVTNPIIPVIPPVGGVIDTPAIPIPGGVAVASPTLGLLPTLTTQNGCNDGYYVDETRPFDGAQLKPNEGFSKGWTIKNTGTCDWDDGYTFTPSKSWSVGIDALKGDLTAITIKKAEDIIKPGYSQLFLLTLQAPPATGQYKWCWKLRDDAGVEFGPLVCTIFDVVK